MNKSLILPVIFLTIILTMHTAKSHQYDQKDYEHSNELKMCFENGKQRNKPMCRG